ncbi:carnosine N-methyltransferase-like isoform X2 [Schistocerca gregaria]|uniref:carnosine N-methyltransferase-like isoform X2 n=1 Tax=Schistocerca gregaria TaxID=7010 RepID=UPI00211EC9CF|nr:carnosine N-methyltransferase-like isoform X2 [Schistocerca gregaria]
MPLRILQNTNEMSQPANTCEEKSFHSKLRSHQGASNHSDPRVRLKPSQTINDNPERNNLKWLKDIVDTECQEKIPEEIESLQNTGSANDGDIDASGDDTCDSSSPSQDASGESARKNDRTQFIVAYATYVNYQRESDYQINQLRRNLESLPPIHQKWLQSPPPEEDANWLSQNDRLTYMRNCTTYNYKLICDMLVSSVSFWSVPELKTSEGLKKELREVKCHPNDLHDFVVKDYKSKFNTEKVRSTLQQIVREWSEEYELERVQSYGIILQELKKRLPVDDSNWNQIRVLCPGSGLGRLPLEICLAGYESIANENSYFMMMMCQFILRKYAQEKVFKPLRGESCLTSQRQVNEKKSVFNFSMGS